MNNSTRAVSSWAPPLLAALLVATTGCRISQPAAHVQIIAINDFHGAIEPPAGATGRMAGVDAGGAEYLAAHISRAIAENPNSIVVAAGDLIGAAPPLSSLLHEEPAIAAMNAAHLAVSSVGNHEFDKGSDELLRMQRGGCHPVDGCLGGEPFSGARFQYLAANIVRTTPDGRHAPLFPPTAVRMVGGVRIGFIGIVTQATPHIVSAGAVKGLSFLDEAETANRYASELKQRGVNAIVLLVHDGGSQERGDAADPNTCAGFRGSFSAVVQKLAPDIRIVASGHTHQAYNCEIAGHTVTSAASNGRLFTRINVAIDRRTDAILSADARNEIVTRDVPKDSAETAIVARYSPFVAPRIERIVGSITATLARAANAAGETPLGDVIADAQLAAARAVGDGGAEVAFMNPGGIRADIPMTHADAAILRGQVSYGDLLTCQPFGNVLNVVTMTGDAIHRLLEEQFHTGGPATMLQVSSGFSYSYRRNAPQGEHVDRSSIVLNGVRVAPDAKVRVAVIDFLLDGGDGFTVLEEATERSAVSSDADALEAYFKANSPVKPGPTDRIRLTQ